MSRKWFGALCLFSLLLSCGGEKAGTQVEVPKNGVEQGGPEAGGAVSIPNSVHGVKCGCAIEGIGKCGEYVEIDGKFLPIEGDLGLGPMPFCHKEGLKAQIEGEVKGGRFHFKTFHLLKQ